MSRSMIARPLLAKSRRNGNELSLRQHLQDTAHAARLIFNQSQRVGRNFVRAFRLAAEEVDPFLINLEISALFHDLGKANEGFALAIEGAVHAQVVRHEHLSAMILQLPEIRAWLCSNSMIRQPIILAAVLSHHLKAKLGEIGSIPIGCMQQNCELYFDHVEVKKILVDIANAAMIGAPPVLDGYKYFSNRYEVWQNCIDEIEREGKRFRRSLENDCSTRRMTAAMKSALIVADSVASAVVREGGSIEDWLNENLHLPAISSEELTRKIIAPCINVIEKRSDRTYEPAKFQLGIAELGSKSLLRAGCGSGKTLAAYYWAARQLDKHECGRVIFLYPTRGTATEGFKDYTGWAPEGEALLLHGQSKYVLESMLANPPESGEGKNYLSEWNQRLFGLAHFNKRFFSATVDQFLSFLQFNYTSICMSILLTDSVIILDEIHSFDHKLFATVLEFLRSMNVPTLCMTATLTESRIKQLSECGLELYPKAEDRKDLSDLAKSEGHKRYRLKLLSTQQDALQYCLQAIENGHKILWVVNTVSRCQRLAYALLKKFPNQVICYHSRFKLSDREKWHKQCVDRFKTGNRTGGVVAITTQVCEMSLDMDADLLISETAPVSSLIQRMGRVNRHIVSSDRCDDFLAPVFIYEPENDLPYDKDDQKIAREYINWLSSRDSGTGISQLDLAEGMEKFSEKTKDPDPFAKLFDSGYFASPDQLRDIDEFTVAAILDADLEQSKKLIAQRKPLDPFIVPVPKSYLLDEKPNWLPVYVRVASAENYEQTLGFKSSVLEEI